MKALVLGMLKNTGWFTSRFGIICEDTDDGISPVLWGWAAGRVNEESMRAVITAAQQSIIFVLSLGS